MTDGASRRAILATAVPIAGLALAGHAAHDQRGDVRLTVYNHRESPVTATVEIERDGEAVFSQEVTLPGDADDQSRTEIDPALRNVQNGDRFAVRTAIDGEERHLDRFTMACPNDPEIEDRISIVISPVDVTLLQNQCG